MRQIFDSLGVVLLVAWMLMTTWIMLEQHVRVIRLEQRIELMENGRFNE